MDINELNKAFNVFGKYMVSQSKANLTRAKKAGGPLYNSISYKIKDEKTKVTLNFFMENYGEFVDQGVKGADPSKVSPNAKEKKQQAPNSPYRYGSGSYAGTWNEFVQKIAAWAQMKNIRLRQYKIVNGKKVATGKFAKGNYETIGQVIAKNIYSRGIKPTYFYTKPFNKAFENLPEEIFDAYAIEFEKGINTENKK
tara:strand:- start:383 stop:973 length:591 start_codon:yes stop_codon:yes gene_type:complete